MMNVPDVFQIPHEKSEEFSSFCSWCDENKRLILSEMQHTDGQDFASSVSFGCFLRVLSRFGGAEIYLSKTPGYSGDLCRFLTGEDRKALISALGYGRFMLPSLTSVQTAIQRAAVRLLHAEGYATGEISQRVGFTNRWVRVMRARIRTEQKKPKRLLELTARLV